MQDLPLILSEWDSCLRSNEEAVLATVVHVQGSAFRHPGAKMLIRQDGAIAGSVSGPCLTATIRSRAWWWTESGPAVVSLATDQEDDETAGRTGCGGGVKLLVERVNSECTGPLEFLRKAAEERSYAVFGTVVSSGECTDRTVGDRIFYIPCEEIRQLLLGRRSRSIRGAGNSQVFFETVTPPRRVVIVGTGKDAEELASLALLFSWEVVIVDARCDPRTRTLFTKATRVLQGSIDECLGRINLMDAAVVVMSHSLEIDAESISCLAKSDASYIGVMGPQKRTDRILQGLRMTPLPNLHYPVGLDIGSETEREIALSIVAEIQASYSGRVLSHLRNLPTVNKAKREVAV